MLQLKRHMLQFGNFEYLISDTHGSPAKIIRHRDGSGFYYSSQGCSNDFSLVMNRKYVSTESVDGDDRRIGGYYSTQSGHQGSVLYCSTTGRSFLKNFFYWAIEYNNVYYKVYEVGGKEEGRYFCFYAGDTLIAIIKKDPKIIHNSTNYEMYFEHYVPKEMLLVVSLFIDLTRYYPDVDRAKRSSEYSITRIKELKEKYDPTFIPRIKAMEGIVD